MTNRAKKDAFLSVTARQCFSWLAIVVNFPAELCRRLTGGTGLESPWPFLVKRSCHRVLVARKKDVNQSSKTLVQAAFGKQYSDWMPRNNVGRLFDEENQSFCVMEVMP